MKQLKELWTLVNNWLGNGKKCIIGLVFFLVGFVMNWFSHPVEGLSQIPFIGGLETKEMGKKYVSGKHTNNGTTLLISNGFHKESNDQHRFMTYDEINIIKLKK